MVNSLGPHHSSSSSSSAPRSSQRPASGFARLLWTNSSSSSSARAPVEKCHFRFRLPSTYTRHSPSRLARTMSASTMDDLRVKSMVCPAGGGGEASSSAAASAAASRIIAQWAARRRQACEQMVLGGLDRRDRDSELMALARLHAVSTMLDASSFLRARADADDGRRARSPERALVRRIAREWTAPAPAQRQGSPRGGHGDGGAGEEWLGETERERVRSVRERVRRASQGGGDGADGHAPGLRGRQARAPGAARRMSMERLRELQGLSEHRAVSSFAHRGRIQSVLRGRIFLGGRPRQDGGPISTAAGQEGQITQSHHRPGTGAENITSDQATNGDHSSLPEDDNQHLENASASHEIQALQPTEDQSGNVPNTHDALQDGHLDQEQHVHGYQEYSSDSGSSDQSGEQTGSSSSDNGGAQEEAIAYVQPTPSVQWRGESSGASGQEAEEEEEDVEEWHVIDNPEAEAQQWRPDLGGFARHNRLQEDALYGMYRAELRELLSRRSVSNLLSSGFRESLDQLVHSYAQRQEEHDPPAPLNQDHVQHHRIHGADQAEHAAQPPAGHRPQRRWRMMPPGRDWSRQPMDRPDEFEVDEAIHDLRDDMAVLQRGMASTQQMLQACMEMQVELQRSIRQEVASAMNGSLSLQGTVRWYDDGSQWELVRKGTCCICCDSQIDSLLYRCGHMCTCSKCARELLRGAGKCPLCRAPIVEVVRAYSII
ncbi:hypothetical protein ZWY2020_035561 [Hordeum vulgare]|nr:hypothetical protein ZWY2020_035561 [Hordeum vulgare]